jgi:poly-gamma-glutamate synthesis protein (capsule biosynthesis protein)
LDTLRNAGIRTAGAGRDLREAEAPAAIAVEGKGRVLFFSYGLPSSGIPAGWGASQERAGVNLLDGLGDPAVERVKRSVEAAKQPGDVVVVSVHWGGNWGYDVPPEQVTFAHRLIDDAGVEVVHGHSSHHVKGIEVYRDRLVLYGCGDFLNDYEGIRGYEQFRGDLALMYFASLDPATGKLVYLRMTPMQTRHLRVNRASGADVLWLRDVLNREGRQFGTWVELNQDDTFTLGWEGG